MPTVNPAPIGPKPQLELSSGLPAVGGLLFSYVAGSVNTKQNTYTNSTGSVANTNPIVLNALGEPATEIWLTAGVSYKFVYAPAGDTDPPTSPIWAIDDLRGINDTSIAIDQWVDLGLTPTFVNATSFTLPGDQTTDFTVGRRTKTTNSGGTVYSTISASVFGALTTVTLVNDSGVLDSGLSAVSLGLLTATNPATPLLTDAYPIVSGSADKTKKLRFEVDGLTTATTRVITVPDADITLGAAASETAAGISEFSTAAEIMTGTDTGRTMSPQRLRDAQGFTAYFESTAQTITAAGGLTLAHGLGRKPILLQMVLKCVNAIENYSIGDELFTWTAGEESSTSQGCAIVPDATNLNIRFGNTASTFRTLNKTTGVGTGLVNTDWSIIFRAWG